MSPLIVQHGLSHIPPGEGVPTDSPAWTQPYSAKGSILADSPAWTQPTSPKLGEGVSLLIVQHGLRHIPPGEGVPTDSPAWTQPYSAKGSIVTDSPAWTQQTFPKRGERVSLLIVQDGLRATFRPGGVSPVTVGKDSTVYCQGECPL